MQKLHSALLALASFFSSKDNWTAIIGAVVFFSAKYGWGVDAQGLWVIAGLVIALITHSALASHGSVAALANQETARLTLEHARLQARIAGMTVDRAEPARRSSQVGGVSPMVIAALAIVGCAVFLGACAWWSSSGKTKAAAGAKAGAVCALGDVGKYLGDYQHALGTDGYDQAVKDVEKKNNLEADATKCALDTIVAVLTAQPTAGALTSQPSIVLVHARAYLASH